MPKAVADNLQHSYQGPGDAHTEVSQSVAKLQGALRLAIDSLAPAITKAPELQRRLNIDRNLAWKTHRLVHARSSAEAARFIPGAGGIAILCKAARQAGVGEKSVGELQEAFEAYEHVARKHAGDRASASLILEAGHASAASGEDLGLRRAAYRAASFACGVRARAHLQSYVISPAVDKPNWLDQVILRGFYDVERLRPEAPFLLTQFHLAKSGDPSFSRPAIKPLKPNAGFEANVGSALLEEFSSRPTPRFQIVPREDGGVEEELSDWKLGRTGAVSVVAGIDARAITNNQSERGNTRSLHGARVRIPCEVLVLDAYVHQSLLTAQPLVCEVYSELSGDASWFTRNEKGLRIPMHVPVQELGRGISSSSSPAIPRYLDLLRYAFTTCGLNAGEYAAYRVVIEFPLAPTNVVLRRHKMEAGGGAALNA